MLNQAVPVYESALMKELHGVNTCRKTSNFIPDTKLEVTKHPGFVAGIKSLKSIDLIIGHWGKNELITVY